MSSLGIRFVLTILILIKGRGAYGGPLVKSVWVLFYSPRRAVDQAGCDPLPGRLPWATD